MKKIFKSVILALAVLFINVICANAENYKITIHYMDTKADPEKPVEVYKWNVSPGGGKRFDLTRAYTKAGVGGDFSKLYEDDYHIEGRSNGNYYYFEGWYDVDGNKVPTDDSYVVTETDSAVLLSAKEVSGTTTDGSNKHYEHSLQLYFKSGITLTENVDVYFYTRWTVKYTPLLNLRYIDNVSTGSGSWANLQHVSSLDHTFKEPEAQPHYQFIYWKNGETIYNPGDVYTYNFEKLDYQLIDNVDVYAWWQPSVTLNLYSDDKLFDSKEDFTSVSIDKTPTKPAYKFMGWADEEGNIVTDTTFIAPDATTEKVERTIINLYAKWERITTDIDITKNWVDNDNIKEARPEEVIVDLYAEDELVDSITLSGTDNKWISTTTVNKYDDEGNLINYSIKEREIADYTSKVDGFTLTNTIKPDGKVIVKYIEKETQEELYSETFEDIIDREYTTEVKVFDDYEYLNEVVGNPNGNFAENDILVTYYYKIKTGTVIAHYVDINGNTIADDETYTGKVGTKYSTEEKEIGIYYLETIKGATDGEFINGTIEVTYIYNISGTGGDDVIIPPQTGDDNLFYIIYGSLFIEGLALITLKNKKYNY